MWEGGYEKKDSFLARIAPSTDCPCQSCRSLQFTSVSSIFGLGPDCFVYSELAPVESNFGARWFGLVYFRTVCVNLVLYVDPVLYSVLHSIP